MGENRVLEPPRPGPVSVYSAVIDRGMPCVHALGAAEQERRTERHGEGTDRTKRIDALLHLL